MYPPAIHTIEIRLDLDRDRDRHQNLVVGLCATPHNSKNFIEIRS